RLPGIEPGIEQVFERMQVPGLAFAVERQPAIQARAPSGETAGLELVGEEGAIGVVNLGDIEVEQGTAKDDDGPEERDDHQGPDPAPSKTAAGSPAASAPKFPMDTMRLAGWMGLRNDDREAVDLGGIAAVRRPRRRQCRVPVDRP